jgi:hypothetical protein
MYLSVQLQTSLTIQHGPALATSGTGREGREAGNGGEKGDQKGMPRTGGAIGMAERNVIFIYGWQWG